MKEIKGNIFEIDADAICVPTNGIVKANGELVMGKGLALEFKNRYPDIPWRLGKLVEAKGNHVYLANFDQEFTAYEDVLSVDRPLPRPPSSKPLPQLIFSFPTKHNWRNSSDLELIKQSANELILQVDYLTQFIPINTIAMTRVGCGNGQLNWETQVKPVLEKILDDRFIIVSL